MPVASRQEDLLVEKEKLGEVVQAVSKVALLRDGPEEDIRYCTVQITFTDLISYCNKKTTRSFSPFKIARAFFLNYPLSFPQTRFN